MGPEAARSLRCLSKRQHDLQRSEEACRFVFTTYARAARAGQVDTGVDVKEGDAPAPATTVAGDGRYETYYANTPFVFMPFNAGPRSCLGQQLAYAEVGVFLCRLVQRLRVRQGAGRERIELDVDAIPEGCRVPRSWFEPATSPSSSEALMGGEKGLPTHASRMHGGTLPPTTASGVSPRRMIEKVWPKSHLTMFVEGGVWIRV